MGCIKDQGIVRYCKRSFKVQGHLMQPIALLEMLLGTGGIRIRLMIMDSQIELAL